MSDTRSYPRHAKTDAGEIEFRLMSRTDEVAVLDFAQKLPTHDLLFLPRNISQPKVLSAWINEIERGDITSLLAVQAARWSLRHAGARSAFVVTACRRDPNGGVTGCSRPGRRTSAVAANLRACFGGRPRKAFGADDGRSAGGDALFESLGFKAEALLREHVRDVEGKKHDIVVLGQQCGAGPGPDGKPMGCRTPCSTRRVNRLRHRCATTLPQGARRSHIRVIMLDRFRVS